MYVLEIGLEQLQTGVEICGSVVFWPESKTMFKLYSHEPFHAKWVMISSETGNLETFTRHAYRDDRVSVPTPETTDYVRQRVLENDTKTVNPT